MEWRGRETGTRDRKKRTENKDGEQRQRQRQRERDGLPVLLGNVLLVLETGTAVTFFFTRDTDLFFAVAVLSTRGKFSGGGERRVLTFPSGWLLVGEVDLELLVGLDACLRGGLPVGGGEDAEGDGDSGFKVQVDDLYRRERIFSYNLP